MWLRLQPGLKRKTGSEPNDDPAEDAPLGTLDKFPFRSTILENSRDIQVWRPAGYGQDPEHREHGDERPRARFRNEVVATRRVALLAHGWSRGPGCDRGHGRHHRDRADGQRHRDRRS